MPTPDRSTSAKAGKILVASPGTTIMIYNSAIQNAVNTAVNGDVIELPEGTFVLNKSVVVTKFISILGKGQTKTILFRAESVDERSTFL